MSATPRGDLPRNEGRRNFPYGPTQRHARKSLFNLGSNTPDKYGAARMRGQSLDFVIVDEAQYLDLASMNRDALRAMCKARKVKGWGKMTTAQMREALA